MHSVETTVRQIILEVLQQSQPDAPPVLDHQQLNADLGLRSLDLAQIVAELELELDTDPFLELVSVTDMRTVGDLCQAYRLSVGGEAAPVAIVAGRGAQRLAAMAPLAP